MISDAAISHNLISEDDQAQIVDVLHVILLNIHTVLDRQRKKKRLMQIPMQTLLCPNSFPKSHFQINFIWKVVYHNYYLLDFL